MSGLLADIYSRSDAFKRRLVDALRNPVDSARQKIGSIADGAREADRLTEAAALEQDRSGPANVALTNYLAERVNPLAMTKVVGPASALQLPEYQGSHRPPMKGSGAPLHNLTEVYPDDVYSKNAVRYYGTGDSAMDAGTFRKVNAYKGNPDAPVTMYRAVPSDVPADAAIRHGDWVTINPAYAKMHGEGPLGGNYRVLEQQVPARKLFTNGDSIHEFGYDETGRVSSSLLAALGAGSAATIAALRSRKEDDRKKKDK